MENKKITLTPEQYETLENMTNYYLVRFSVESIMEKHPGFVVEDFGKVLAILETAMEN